MAQNPRSPPKSRTAGLQGTFSLTEQSIDFLCMASLGVLQPPETSVGCMVDGFTGLSTVACASDSRSLVVDDNEPGLQLSLENLDLTLRVLHQLQLIGVHTIRQVRTLLTMEDKTRSHIVTILRRARSKGLL